MQWSMPGTSMLLAAQGHVFTLLICSTFAGRCLHSANMGCIAAKITSSN